MGVSHNKMNSLVVLASLLGMAAAIPYPFPDGPGRPSGPPEGPLSFPRPGKDGNYAAGDYFQYINVPAHKVYEWGYRREDPATTGIKIFPKKITPSSSS